MPATSRVLSSRPTASGAPPSITRLLNPSSGRAHLAEFSRAVRDGLGSSRKTLPCEYFYDAEGSKLFEAICELPEYYPTRTEDALLRDYADEMTDNLGAHAWEARLPTIVELGSGSATKTRRLITSALARCDRLRYVPIDVSGSALEESIAGLSARFPRLQLTGCLADYQRGLRWVARRDDGPRLIVFLGSSLGNAERPQAVALLSLIAQTMRPEDRFLLGTDMVKDRSILEPAYDDAQGVTAAFNRNILTRIDRELGADFQPDQFDHRAIYVPSRGRIEMHLVSPIVQSVHIPGAGLNISFAPGESIHTENSHKYTRGQLLEMAAEAGFEEERVWTDSRKWFQVQRWRLRG